MGGTLIKAGLVICTYCIQYIWHYWYQVSWSYKHHIWLLMPWHVRFWAFRGWSSAPNPIGVLRSLTPLCGVNPTCKPLLCYDMLDLNVCQTALPVKELFPHCWLSLLQALRSFLCCFLLLIECLLSVWPDQLQPFVPHRRSVMTNVSNCVRSHSAVVMLHYRIVTAVFSHCCKRSDGFVIHFKLYVMHCLHHTLGSKRLNVNVKWCAFWYFLPYLFAILSSKSRNCKEYTLKHFVTDTKNVVKSRQLFSHIR